MHALLLKAKPVMSILRNRDFHYDLNTQYRYVYYVGMNSCSTNVFKPIEVTLINYKKFRWTHQALASHRLKSKIWKYIPSSEMNF